MLLIAQQISWIAPFTSGAGVSPEQRDELSLKDRRPLARQKKRAEALVLREHYINRAHDEIVNSWEALKVFRGATAKTSEGKMDMIGAGGDQSKKLGFL